jgi:hypothetical protein
LAPIQNNRKNYSSIYLYLKFFFFVYKRLILPSILYGSSPCLMCCM